MRSNNNLDRHNILFDRNKYFFVMTAFNNIHRLGKICYTYIFLLRWEFAKNYINMFLGNFMYCRVVYDCAMKERKLQVYWLSYIEYELIETLYQVVDFMRIPKTKIKIDFVLKTRLTIKFPFTILLQEKLEFFVVVLL